HTSPIAQPIDSAEPSSTAPSQSSSSALQRSLWASHVHALSPPKTPQAQPGGQSAPDSHGALQRAMPKPVGKQIWLRQSAPVAHGAPSSPPLGPASGTGVPASAPPPSGGGEAASRPES